VAARKITGPELARRSRSGGFLGIRIAEARNGVRIAEVIHGGAAERVGFAEDDVIVAVENNPITDPESLFKDRADFQNQLGSKLSDHRTGFPMVLQHDTVLRPVDCGGPLVDLNGKVIGINIARAGRTETLAIPAEAVKPLLDDLKSDKLALPK
jgi:serine protease Do